MTSASFREAASASTASSRFPAVRALYRRCLDREPNYHPNRSIGLYGHGRASQRVSLSGRTGNRHGMMTVISNNGHHSSSGLLGSRFEVAHPIKRSN